MILLQGLDDVVRQAAYSQIMFPERNLEGNVRYKYQLAREAMFDLAQREQPMMMATLEFGQLDIEGGGKQEGVYGYRPISGSGASS